MATSAGRTEGRGGAGAGCRQLMIAALALGSLCSGCASVFHPVEAARGPTTTSGPTTRLAVASQGSMLDAGTDSPADAADAGGAGGGADEAARTQTVGGEQRQGRALRLMREYAQACSVADARGHLDLAERACRWSLAAAEAAPADPLLVSQSQYQLGQVLRRRGQFARAETHFQAALAIELQQPVISSRRVGSRLIELAAVQAGQRRWQRGRRTLEQALPYSSHLFGSQRAYAAEVYSRYSAHLRDKPGGDSQARRFEARALALR